VGQKTRLPPPKLLQHKLTYTLTPILFKKKKNTHTHIGGGGHYGGGGGRDDRYGGGGGYANTHKQTLTLTHSSAFDSNID